MAVELALKALIARQAFHLLFKGLPKELELALCYPKSVEGKFVGSPHLVDLTHATHETIGLDEAISLAYVIVPKLHDELRSHLKTVRAVRNASLHYLIPKANRYQLERIAYVALRVAELMGGPEPDPDADVFDCPYRLTDQDRSFLSGYDQNRIEAVAKKVDAARARARTSERSSADVDDWRCYVVSCPVCGSDGVMSGETSEEQGAIDPDYGPSPYLMFVGDSFECEVCGLKLDDPIEMGLAGLNPIHERPETDTERWPAEAHGPWDHY